MKARARKIQPQSNVKKEKITRKDFLLLNGVVLGLMFAVLGNVIAKFLWAVSSDKISLGLFAFVVIFILINVAIMLVIKFGKDKGLL